MLFCEDCSLVQLTYVVDADLMFRNYAYVSGTTRTLTEHFRLAAAGLTKEFATPPGSLVVDIGSNDGTFLRQFQNLGMTVMGVDPASNVAAMANRGGVETLNEYFGAESARHVIEKTGRRADLMTAAGVFFHIDDMDDVCRGIKDLLAPDGVFQVQAIYLGDMLENNSFDNVYHEHVSYYTLKPLLRLFDRFGLEVFHVGNSPIHGGTLLVYICHRGARPVRESVAAQLKIESDNGWHGLQAYRDFALRVQALRASLVEILDDLQRQGKRLAAFGAPAKGNTLLNYCRLGPPQLAYAAEKAPLKIGLYTPGMRLPVIDEAEVMADPPDYFLMLPWNFKEELLANQSAYRSRGGKFIIPIPAPEIV
jgi:SAM-dependent methyltransferase